MRRTTRVLRGHSGRWVRAIFLGVVLANPLLVGVEVPLARPPPIRIIARHATRLQEYLQLEQHGILSALADVG